MMHPVHESAPESRWKCQRIHLYHVCGRTVYSRTNLGSWFWLLQKGRKVQLSLPVCHMLIGRPDNQPLNGIQIIGDLWWNWRTL